LDPHSVALYDQARRCFKRLRDLRKRKRLAQQAELPETGNLIFRAVNKTGNNLADGDQ